MHAEALGDVNVFGPAHYKHAVRQGTCCLSAGLVPKHMAQGKLLQSGDVTRDTILNTTNLCRANFHA